jgi:hypothetical protein
MFDILLFRNVGLGSHGCDHEEYHLVGSLIHSSFYLAFISATTITLEQGTSFNTSFLKSFCPKGLKD